jgi:gustatory receptor
MNVIKEEDFDRALGNFREDFRNLTYKEREANSKLTHRERERKIREKLQSRHGETAEIHDQFYRDHKLLLVLFRALAVMPIERSSPGRITFSWKSKASIYAFFFYMATTVIVLIVGYERIKFLNNTEKFDDYIYGVLFIIFLVSIMKI